MTDWQARALAAESALRRHLLLGRAVAAEEAAEQVEEGGAPAERVTIAPALRRLAAECRAEAFAEGHAAKIAAADNGTRFLVVERR